VTIRLHLLPSLVLPAQRTFFGAAFFFADFFFALFAVLAIPSSLHKFLAFPRKAIHVQLLKTIKYLAI